MMVSKLEKEEQILAAMVGIYCRGKHEKDGKGLCAECAELLEYAVKRLTNCKIGEEKLPCSKCSVHCYKPEMREKIRAVMKYAGPRMIKRHPILAARHLIVRMKHKFHKDE